MQIYELIEVKKKKKGRLQDVQVLPPSKLYLITSGKLWLELSAVSNKPTDHNCLWLFFFLNPPKVSFFFFFFFAQEEGLKASCYGNLF